MSRTELSFTVPLPVPTGNHYKTPFQSKGKMLFFVTREAKAFFDAVAIFARGETLIPEDPKERKQARYGVQMHVYLAPGRHMDFDNAWKCGLDALVKAHIIHSDAAVDGRYSNSVIHGDDRENPRTEYTIRRIDGQD